MDIKNIKDLEAVFKLARKHGITEISISGITAKLGDIELKSALTPETETKIPEQYSEEDILFWSSQQPS